MILDRGRGCLTVLEEHLSEVFMRRAEERLQRLVFGRVELPQIANPSDTEGSIG